MYYSLLCISMYLPILIYEKYFWKLFLLLHHKFKVTAGLYLKIMKSHMVVYLVHVVLVEKIKKVFCENKKTKIIFCI